MRDKKVDVKKEGNTMTITIELSEDPKPSSTGKTLILFTSHGFQWEGDAGINLTVVKKRNRT